MNTSLSQSLETEIQTFYFQFDSLISEAALELVYGLFINTKIGLIFRNSITLLTSMRVSTLGIG